MFIYAERLWVIYCSFFCLTTFFLYFSKVNVDYLYNKNEARLFPQIILGVK